MSEEFHCTPDAIVIARDRLPVGLLDEVIEMRRFTEVVLAYKRDPASVIGTRLGNLALEFDAEQAHAEIDKAKAGNDTHG